MHNELFAVLQGFPHPLHSAELILQLIRKVSSTPSGGVNKEPTTSITFSDVNEPSDNVDDSLNNCKVTHHAANANSNSIPILSSVAEDVRHWALKHAYSSSWIKHFQCST